MSPHLTLSLSLFFFWKYQGISVLKTKEVVVFVGKNFLLFKIVWIIDLYYRKTREKLEKEKRGLSPRNTVTPSIDNLVYFFPDYFLCKFVYINNMLAYKNCIFLQTAFVHCLLLLTYLDLFMSIFKYLYHHTDA